MPGDIKEVINGKSVQFTIKTGNGKWKCQVHSDRAAYERARSSSSSLAAAAGAPVLPGITRSDSGLSTSSAASTSSH
ncbi:hypothetical protein SLS62_000266 [Diatrype stigma]|uniref:Uncharacterized protein n=1 Tax=Diatrype stigma TaxID=117547 RepID=A0AAN9V0M8_9PEZI